jgi:membrane protease subunit (stomatin/prohibitin family)
VAGTEARFTVDQIEDQLRDLLVSRFADAIGGAKLAAIDLAGNYDRIGRLVAAQIQPDFTNFGLQIVNLLVENISLPPEVEAAMDKRTSMGVIGNMQTFTQYEAASAIPKAAENPGGLGAVGAQIAVGYAIGNQMAGGMNALQTPSTTAAPPPLPGAATYYIAMDGKQAGPFPADQLAQKVSQGQFRRDSLVWKHGMAQWQQAGTLPELENLFADLPPAVPTQ